MRLAALTLIGSLFLAAAPIAAASAAPAIPAVAPGHAATANLIQVSGGCGPAYHPNVYGYCVPNYYAYPVYGYGYGYGYGHWGHGWGWGHGGWGHWHH
jgi:hypothetical protein